MEKIILDIAAALRRAAATGETFDAAQLVRLLHAYNKPLGQSEQFYTKKKLLPYYLKTKAEDPARWESWNIDPATERALVQLLQIKPRRTSSGVATITVITKPWGCSSNCIYCPNDIRMPKSYLSNEPACQRAERNFFDPYLQVTARLHALREMGHTTDKVELIVLGGTWTDYPEDYQYWYMTQLFRALNNGESAPEYAAELRERYERAGIPETEEALRAFAAPAQAAIDAGTATFNEAHRALYGQNSPWQRLAAWQTAEPSELEQQQRINETAEHRCVGLVIETRPDTITPQTLTRARHFGCTKIQMGIQSLDPAVLAANHRATSTPEIQRAFALLRLFGFKLHAHFMVNLYGSTPTRDKEDFRQFVTDNRFLPDEIKVYPCVLTKGTQLERLYEQGKWRAYSEEDLLDILVHDICATPAYCRISRMIRDISSDDIIAGNKKTNLRQLAELSAAKTGERIQEMRYREIKGKATDLSELRLDVVPYETSVSREFFLQWVTPQNELAGFLRLSLPLRNALATLGDNPPVLPGQAMIREVHVYGRAAHIDGESQNAQHLGLGKKLIARACEIAAGGGYDEINVISAVGTRAYYRSLGFATSENGLYQTKRIAHE